MKVVGVTTRSYGQQYGQFMSARVRTRVFFTDEQTGEHPDVPFTGLKMLLPDVYERMAGQPHAPLPMPDRVASEWEEADRCFRLRGKGLSGFSVHVVVRLEETWGEVR